MSHNREQSSLLKSVMSISFHAPMIRLRWLLLLCGAITLLTTACASPNQSLDSGQTSEKAIARQLSSLPQAELVVYRSPTCGCCGAWLEQMQALGFQVQDNVTEGVDAIKAENSLPQELAACHTTLVNGYVVEGHVPAADIVRLLSEKPDVVGIAVPGMPIGSPGMESGDTVEPYATLTFDRAGNTTVFQKHGV